MKKQSNPPPPKCGKGPPPPAPPNRMFVQGLMGEYETAQSIQRRKDYEIYMKGWKAGYNARKPA